MAQEVTEASGWHMAGKQTEMFYVRTNHQSYVAGGIPNKNQPADNTEKYVTAEKGPLSIQLRKGEGHAWTRFCEDTVFVYERPQVTILGVFDGISGPQDGSGGQASRMAATILQQLLANTSEPENNIQSTVQQFHQRCQERITRGDTTALIAILTTTDSWLWHVGDSLCFADGVQQNRTHGIGSLLTATLVHSEKGKFQKLASYKRLALCSDGIYADGYDDQAKVQYKKERKREN